MARFTHRFRLTIGYAILVVAVVIALALSLANQQRIEEKAQDDARALCESNNELKQVIVTLIERIDNDSGDGRTDFTKIAGFDQLDPNTQDYLRALSAPRGGGDDDDDHRLTRIAREVLVPKDCDRRPGQ